MKKLLFVLLIVVYTTSIMQLRAESPVVQMMEGEIRAGLTTPLGGYHTGKASVNFTIDRFIIGAGYGISNLDYYSGRRNVTLANGKKFYVPKKELSQSIFLSVGYFFNTYI